MTILGSGYSSIPSQNSVTFGGAAAVVSSSSNTLIQTTVPAAATTGPIAVSVTGSGNATSSSSFTVTGAIPAPTISTFSPTVASANTTITITGTNFYPNASSNTVLISGVTVPVLTAAATTLTVSVPSICGSGHITVQTPSGTAVSAGDLIVVPLGYSVASAVLETRVTLGQPATTTFSAGSQLGLIVFDGTQGQTIRLLADTASQNQTVSVYKPDGTLLLSANGLATWGTSIIDTPPLPVTGTYMAVVGDDPAWLGQVTLMITTPPVSADFAVYAASELYQNHPTGQAYRAFVSFGSSFNQTVSLTATGLPTGATASFNPSSFTSNGSSELSFTLSNVTPGNYPFTLSATGGSTTHTLSLTLIVDPLPSPWQDTDVNAGIAGRSEYSNGVFTVDGSGDGGNGGDTDAFHFAYQSMTGDGTIVARVVSMYNVPTFESGAYALGGIMIRQTPTSGAPFFHLRLRTVTGIEVQTPTTLTRPIMAATAPYWLKITRQGNNFTVFSSPDGNAWTQLGSTVTISMTSAVTVGLTAAGDPFGQLAQVVLDNVTITSAPDFTVTATPASQTVAAGNSTSYTVNVGAVSGFTGAVNLTTGTLPSGVTATFSPSSVSGSGSSTLTLTTSSSTPVGLYTVTIVGTSGSSSRSTPVSLSVGGADFSVAVSPSSITTNISTSATYTVTVGLVNGFTGTVNLNITGVPSGSTAAFNPVSLSTPGTSTLTITVGANTASRSYPLVITGTSNSGTHSAAATLVVALSDFAISLDTPWMTFPASGGTATRNVTTTVANGFTKTITLSTTGLPIGATSSFNPTTITGAGTSVLTVTTTAGVSAGTYNLAVTGTAIDPVDNNPTHSINDALVVYTSGALPSGWTDSDIGAVGIAGLGGFTGMTFTEQGSGLGLFYGTTSDQLHFTYQTLNGDGTVIARVANVENLLGQAGIMIRESVNPTAAAAFLEFQNNGSSANYSPFLMWRGSDGGSGNNIGINPSAIVFPYWVKLVRQGSTFNGYLSSDGINWGSSPAASATITMATSSIAGVAVDAASDITASTAAFDEVTVTGTSPDFYLLAVPVTKSVPTAASSAYYSIRLLPLNGFTGSTTFSVGALPSGVTGGLTATTVAANGATNLLLSVPAGMAAGTYPITVTATSGALSHSVTVNLGVSSTAPALPTPWTSDDLGTGQLAGSANLSGGTATVGAAGNALNANSDIFRYTYQPLAGDGTIVTRVSNYQNVWDTARFGPMIRESLSPDSAYVCMCIRTSAGFGTYTLYPDFQYRSSTGASVTEVNGSSISLPYWLKLTRQGNTFTSYTSLDGNVWIQGTSVTVNMASQVFVGLAASSGQLGQISTLTFDNLNVLSNTNGAADFALTVIPASQSVSSGAAITYYTLKITPLNGFTATINFTVTSLPTGASFTPVSSTGGNSATLTITTTSSTPVGSYPLTISGTSGSLNHSAGATLVITSGAATTLPSPWSNDDVGTPIAGTASSYLNGTFTVTGSGCCLSANGDSFQYAYQPLNGDGTIVARVVSKNQTFSTDKAGVMIRESLAADAVNAFVGLETGAGSIFDARTAEGNPPPPPTAGSASAAPPYWVKLVRAGSLFTGYSSSDGISWGNPIAPNGNPPSIPMATSALVGLAVSPEAGGALMTATFDNVVVATAPDFYLVSSASVPPLAGSNATFTVNVNSLMGFNSAVTLSVSNLPAGAALVSFSPNPVTGGSGPSTLTISTQTTLSGGSYPFTITGTSGSLTHSISATLVVKNYTVSVAPASQTIYDSDHIAYTVTVTAAGGFNSAVSLTVSGLPSNVTGAFSPTSVTPNSSGIATSTLTLTSTSRASAVTTNFTVTGASSPLSHTGTGTVIVNTSPAYRVSLSPVSQEINAGISTTYSVSVAWFNGFTGTVTLGTTGLPSGATGVFSPTSVTPTSTSSTLTVSTTRTATPGTANFTVDTTSSLPIQHTAATLILDPPGDFTVTSVPNSLTVASGTSAVYTVVVTPYYTFNSAVSLTVSGLPSGATATFNPASLPNGSGQGTLTITTTGVANGTSNLTITGTSTSPALTHTATATLNIGTSADFSMTTSSVRDFVLPGHSSSPTITIAAANGFNASVSLSASGLPTGATATFSTNPVSGAGSSSLSIAVGSTTAVGTYQITITGTSGTLTHTVTYTLVVIASDFTISASPVNSNQVFIVNDPSWYAAYNITLTALNGFNSPVTYTTSGPPSCVATSPGLLQIDVNTGSCTPSVVGHYPTVITGAAANGPIHSAPSVDMFLVDFELSASPTSLTINKGNAGTSTITVSRNPTNGLGNNIGFSATVSPSTSNITTSFNPTAAFSSSVLTIIVASHTTSGTYTVTVKGVPSGAFSPARTIPITVTVP